MTIELITKEDYDTLIKIQKEYPILTFQNEGYQYIDKSKFTKKDQHAFSAATEILKENILGFTEFNNFQISNRTGKIKIRFQYIWDADDDENAKRGFIGVGYILLDELYKGFKKE